MHRQMGRGLALLLGYVLMAIALRLVNILESFLEGDGAAEVPG